MISREEFGTTIAAESRRFRRQLYLVIFAHILWQILVTTTITFIFLERRETPPMEHTDHDLPQCQALRNTTSWLAV